MKGVAPPALVFAMPRQLGRLKMNLHDDTFYFPALGTKPLHSCTVAHVAAIRIGFPGSLPYAILEGRR